MSGGYKGKSWFNLKRYLDISATNSGLSIFHTMAKHKTLLRLNYTNGVKYKNSILSRKSQLYLNVSAINDRLGNPSGPFPLQISFDSSGFFLVNGK